MPPALEGGGGVGGSGGTDLTVRMLQDFLFLEKKWANLHTLLLVQSYKPIAHSCNLLLDKARGGLQLPTNNK